MVTSDTTRFQPFCYLRVWFSLEKNVNNVIILSCRTCYRQNQKKIACRAENNLALVVKVISKNVLIKKQKPQLLYYPDGCSVSSKLCTGSNPVYAKEVFFQTFIYLKLMLGKGCQHVLQYKCSQACSNKMSRFFFYLGYSWSTCEKKQNLNLFTLSTTLWLTKPHWHVLLPTMATHSIVNVDHSVIKQATAIL